MIDFERVKCDLDSMLASGTRLDLTTTKHR